MARKSILDSLPDDVRKQLVHDMRSINMKKYNAARKQLKTVYNRMSEDERELFETMDYSEKRAVYLHDSNDNAYTPIRISDYVDVQNLMSVVNNFDDAVDTIFQMQKIIDYLASGPIFLDNYGSVQDIIESMEFVKEHASADYLNNLLSSKYEQMDEKFYYATEKMPSNLRDIRRDRTSTWWNQRVEEVKNHSSYVHAAPVQFDRKRTNKPKTKSKSSNKSDKWKQIYPDMPF